MINKRLLPLMRLEKGRNHEFGYTPTSEEIRAIVNSLSLRKLRIDSITGQVSPDKRGLFLRATIKGRATQNCVISGAPVQNDLALRVERIFEENPESLPTDLTLEQDFDDRVEVLPQSLDLVDLITEEIALALPDYPRLSKFENDEAQEFIAATTSATRDDEELDEKPHPFSGLKVLLDEKNNTK